jgi:hypothetical protein
LAVFVFVKLARDVGWKQAYLSEQEGRWGFPRRLGMAGWILIVLGSLGIAIQSIIRGGFP